MPFFHSVGQRLRVFKRGYPHSPRIQTYGPQGRRVGCCSITAILSAYGSGSAAKPKQSADIIGQRTDDARRQPATDQDEHDGRTQTVEHLFVDEMNSFDDLSHAKHIVRCSTVCKVRSLQGPKMPCSFRLCGDPFLLKCWLLRRRILFADHDPAAVAVSALPLDSGLAPLGPQ